MTPYRGAAHQRLYPLAAFGVAVPGSFMHQSFPLGLSSKPWSPSVAAYHQGPGIPSPLPLRFK